MNKIFVIARREFQERVRSRTFLFTAIGTPLILIAIWFFTGGVGVDAQAPDLGGLSEISPDMGMIGYVDQAGLINEIPAPIQPGQFQSYPDQASAEEALKQGKIDAYFLVPADYREMGEVQRISDVMPTSPPDTETFEWILIRNLFSDIDEGQISRLRYPFRGNEPRFVSLVRETEGEAEGGDIGNMMLPFIVTMAIMLPLFTGGGYLLQSLTKEKGSRIMEVLLVSLRPRQLLTGKLLGLGALVLVQYGIWVLIGGVLFQVLNQEASGLLASVRFSSQELVFILLFALGGFCLYAALMGGVGALAPDMEGSRTWTFLITLPMMAPIYFWTAIAGTPNGTLALALSMFPYSSPVAMLLRMTVTKVPIWQIGTSVALLALAVVATVWAMSRLFHAQSLLSGESLSLQRFWKAFTQS
ncbi:MAG: ABC transporter permease [Anaerolineales bacterium]